MCVKIHTDAHTAQHIRCCAGEEFTIIPGVISNNHTTVFTGFCAIGVQQISAKAHSRLTYGVLVHTVGASAHYTAQPTRTKLKITIEAILDFFVIINGFKFLTSCLIKELVIQPVFISFPIAHNLKPLNLVKIVFFNQSLCSSSRMTTSNGVLFTAQYFFVFL